MDVLSLLLTLAAALIGSFIFLKLKVPAGALLGTMVFVIILNIVKGNVFFPQQARPIIRILAGSLIGSRMKKDDVLHLKTIVLPAVLLVFGMLILNISLGYIIHRLTGMNLLTSLLGSAPGGIQDMAIIADDIGADTAKITVLQTVRVFMVVGIMPTLLRAFSKKYSISLPDNGDFKKNDSKRKPAGGINAPAGSSPKAGQKAVAFLRTMIFAVIGGLLVDMTGMPAGAMVGAMAGTVLATLFIKPSFVPAPVGKLTQALAGIMLGNVIGAEELAGLKSVAVPSLILVVVLLAIVGAPGAETGASCFSIGPNGSDVLLP